jgi:Spy/CpxP family protein refolding chaperone
MVMLPAPILAAGEGPPEGRGGKPPAEAVDACRGKKSGEEVTFTLRNGEKVNGICRDMRGELVAVPDREGRGGQSGQNAPPSKEQRGVDAVKELSTRLGLSASQEKQVRALLDEEDKANAQLRRSRTEGQQKLLKLSEGELFDEKAVRAAAAAVEKDRTELQVSYLRIMHRIRTLLSPEQRVKAKGVAPMIRQMVQGDPAREEAGPRPE